MSQQSTSGYEAGRNCEIAESAVFGDSGGVALFGDDVFFGPHAVVTNDQRVDQPRH